MNLKDMFSFGGQMMSPEDAQKQNQLMAIYGGLANQANALGSGGGGLLGSGGGGGGSAGLTATESMLMRQQMTNRMYRPRSVPDHLVSFNVRLASNGYVLHVIHPEHDLIEVICPDLESLSKAVLNHTAAMQMENLDEKPR